MKRLYQDNSFFPQKYIFRGGNFEALNGRSQTDAIAICPMEKKGETFEGFIIEDLEFDREKIKRGQKNKAVEKLQVILSQFGFYSLRIDQDFGPGTEKALINFRKKFEKYFPNKISFPTTNEVTQEDIKAFEIWQVHKNTKKKLEDLAAQKKQGKEGVIGKNTGEMIRLITKNDRKILVENILDKPSQKEILGSLKTFEGRTLQNRALFKYLNQLSREKINHLLFKVEAVKDPIGFSYEDHNGQTIEGFYFMAHKDGQIKSPYDITSEIFPEASTINFSSTDTATVITKDGHGFIVEFVSKKLPIIKKIEPLSPSREAPTKKDYDTLVASLDLGRTGYGITTINPKERIYEVGTEIHGNWQRTRYQVLGSGLNRIVTAV